MKNLIPEHYAHLLYQLVANRYLHVLMYFTTLSQNVLGSRQELKEVTTQRISLSSVFFETLMHFTEVLYFGLSFLPTQKSQSCKLLPLDPQRDYSKELEKNITF